MIKYTIISAVFLIILASWAYNHYDNSRLLDALDNQMTLMIKNTKERTELKESLISLNNQDGNIDSFESARNGPIHKAVVKTADGNYYYLVYLEHHSNRHEINKVYVISDSDILDCNNGHICGSAHIIGKRKDLNDLILTIKKSD